MAWIVGNDIARGCFSVNEELCGFSAIDRNGLFTPPTRPPTEAALPQSRDTSQSRNYVTAGCQLVSRLTWDSCLYALMFYVTASVSFSWPTSLTEGWVWQLPCVTVIVFLITRCRYMYTYLHIAGVPRGKDLTSGQCYLGQTIPI